MQSLPKKITIKVKRDQNEVSDSAFPGIVDNKIRKQNEPNGSTPGHLDSKRREQDDTNSSPSDCHHDSTLEKHVDINSSDEEGGGDYGTENEDNHYKNAENQLVVYDPAANGTGKIEAVPNPSVYQTPTSPRHHFQSRSSVLPSVGAFTVQCADCLKWRIIPTKEKYEELREHHTKVPFVCGRAREWRPEISCGDPPDLVQDGSRLWAIDKPDIALPPPGWQRLLRIRGEGGTRFADVYYVAPCKKHLRSKIEVQKYLQQNPKYLDEGVTIEQFSFQTPKPLQEDYVRKRPARSTYGGSNLRLIGSLEPSEVNPIAWAGPDENPEVQLRRRRSSSPHFESPVFERVYRPAKRARTPAKGR